MTSKYFAFVYPSAKLEHLFRGTQWEGGSLWGSPRASLYHLLVPHWDSIPGTAPVQPQSIFGSIIRDLIAASSALPCPKNSLTTMLMDDLLPTLIMRKGESNLNCNYSRGGRIKTKNKIHHEDTVSKMPCNSHDMLHPPHPYGGKLTLWQIYEDV